MANCRQHNRTFPRTIPSHGIGQKDPMCRSDEDTILCTDPQIAPRTLGVPTGS